MRIPIGKEADQGRRESADERGQKVEGVANHGLPLAEKWKTAGVITVPERQLEIFEDCLARHHGGGPAVPDGGAQIGALVIVRDSFRIAGESGHFSVKEKGVAVIIRRKKTLSEKNDRITTEHEDRKSVV